MSRQDAAVPRASYRELFAVSYCGLTAFWMPLAVIAAIDGLRMFLTVRDIAANVALLVVFLVATAATLGMLAWLAASVWHRTKARDTIAWSLVLLPVGTLCAWQFAFDAWHWFLVISPLHEGAHFSVRLGLVATIAAILTWLWVRFGAGQCVRMLIEAAVSVRPIVLLALIVSTGFLFLQPRVIALRSRAHANAPAGSGAAARSPDILLISLDSLAAADANVCGPGPTLMPRLRKLAGQATCFSRAYASSNFTTPTSATLETGVLPWTHLATQIDARVVAPVRNHSLGLVLSAAGYTAYSVSANLLATPRHHGTDHGYSAEILVPSDSLRTTARQWFTVFPNASISSFFYSTFLLLGTVDIYVNRAQYPDDPERVYGVARSLLSASGDRGPVFVWLHTMPPHFPYLPPDTTRYRLLPRGQLDRWRELLPESVYYSPAQQQLVDRHRQRYRECIMGADEALGRLLDYLDLTGRLATAMVIVTADHGESFEKGYLGHAGPLLHEALIHIPLVIKAPGQSMGRVVQTPVSQADIAPTIREFAHASGGLASEGRSLAAALGGGALEPEPVFSMTLERASRFAPLRKGSVAVIAESYKLVYYLDTRAAELYELSADPFEMHDVAAAHPDLVEHLRHMVEQRLRYADAVRERNVSAKE